MKEILIFQKGSNPVLIKDNDNSKIQTYTKKLSSLLKSDTVAILETSDSSIIIRPSQISSIRVTEEPDKIEIDEEDMVTFQQIEINNSESIQEDKVENVVEDKVEDVVTGKVEDSIEDA